jgi:hypothetical protein
VTIDGAELASVLEKELDKLLANLKFEDFLARASQVMEIYEMFDKAAAASSEYGQGYQDGFWAGRALDTKYQLAKVEAIVEKSLDYLKHHK